MMSECGGFWVGLWRVEWDARRGGLRVFLGRSGRVGRWRELRRPHRSEEQE
jgi:hypothetical protein